MNGHTQKLIAESTRNILDKIHNLQRDVTDIKRILEYLQRFGKFKPSDPPKETSYVAGYKCWNCTHNFTKALDIGTPALGKGGECPVCGVGDGGSSTHAPDPKFHKVLERYWELP